jgi:hypothetical protein
MNTTEQIDSQKPKRFTTILIWSSAVIITVFSAYYQRVTGPTYPLKNKIVFQGKEIFYELPRSGNSYENTLIKLKSPFDNLKGVLLWRRFETRDDLSRADMTLVNGELTGELPKQPPMDKLEYNVRLIAGNSEVTIPDEPVVIRYKDNVPIFYLWLHILGMFGALLLAVRSGLEPLKKEPQLKKFTFWTIGFLTFGGIIMGAVVTKYAFGLYWTGFPVGTDLTDNKTLLCWIVWVITAVMVYKSKKPKLWVVIASVVTLLIFLIPHSLVL